MRSTSFADRRPGRAELVRRLLERPHVLGTSDATCDVLDGAWEYPGGGGYPSTMTRVR